MKEVRAAPDWIQVTPSHFDDPNNKLISFQLLVTLVLAPMTEAVYQQVTVTGKGQNSKLPFSYTYAGVEYFQKHYKGCDCL